MLQHLKGSRLEANQFELPHFSLFLMPPLRCKTNPHPKFGIRTKGGVGSLAIRKAALPNLQHEWNKWDVEGKNENGLGCDLWHAAPKTGANCYEWETAAELMKKREKENSQFSLKKKKHPRIINGMQACGRGGRETARHPTNISPRKRKSKKEGGKINDGSQILQQVK